MLKTNKGITLIALIITIIVLLILAGITIGMLTSNNGILRRATGSKTETEKGEELEIVRISSMEMASKESIEDREKLNHEEMELIVENNSRGLSFELLDDDDGYIVEFTQRKRYYKIYDNGETEEIDVQLDKSPGDITKDKDGNDLDGTTKPFEIWSIEDLVEFSENYTQYQTSNIILGRTLDFKMKLSYTDGKMLGCNSIEELMDRLTNTDNSGYKPIYSFSGTFDGLNHSIKNIFENVNTNGGLFESISNATISNLTVTGNIEAIKNAGGISGSINNSSVKNCKNYINIVGHQRVGGIGGLSSNESYIIDCFNAGNLKSDSGTVSDGGIGGMIGSGSLTTMINCYTTDDCLIESDNFPAGGIIGYITTSRSKCTIYNCYNLAEIRGIKVGGLVGYLYSGYVDCINCYSIGNLSGTVAYGLIGSCMWFSGSNTFINAYFEKNDVIKIGGTGLTENGIGITSVTLNEINTLNSYIENHEGEIDTTGWAKWNIEGENPILDYRTKWNGTKWASE